MTSTEAREPHGGPPYKSLGGNPLLEPNFGCYPLVIKRVLENPQSIQSIDDFPI